MATTTNILPTMGKEVTVHDIFQKTLDKTTHWLKDIKNECNLTDIHQAYTLLRAVLFTIRSRSLVHACPVQAHSSHNTTWRRDRAPMSDMVHFSAQLPMLVRGFFFEGWVPYDTPDKGELCDTTPMCLSLEACV
jgi:hypothetical protein